MKFHTAAVVCFVLTTLIVPGMTYYLGDPITVVVPATAKNETIGAAKLMIDGTVISLVVPNVCGLLICKVLSVD